jgi:KDO2-lipid IV(A) lauroyltransferase
MKTLIVLFSRLPFSALHLISDFGFLLLYYGIGYRKKVVRENLARSFPEKSEAERLLIEKQFFRNFADILIETIKTFTITEAELRERIEFKTPEVARELWEKRVNVAGISSHLANWELLAQSLSLEFNHLCFGVFKPLSSPAMNEAVVVSRQRFGIRMIPMKAVRRAIREDHGRPYLLGLLSDQAPHDYEKAFEVEFLSQKTFVVPGPGILTIQENLTPIWGWMRRTGRSRFEWGVEVLSFDPPAGGFTDEQRVQILRISKAHKISEADAARALALILNYSKRLEAQIKMAPQDWLWSHRRWKSRASSTR